MCRVVVPITGGPAVLPDVTARLAGAGISVLELALRRPTLDDVFLALTGEAVAAPSTADSATAGNVR